MIFISDLSANKRRGLKQRIVICKKKTEKKLKTEKSLKKELFSEIAQKLISKVSFVQKKKSRSENNLQIVKKNLSLRNQTMITNKNHCKVIKKFKNF